MIELLIAILCGLLLGAIFYGGLWLTVQHVIQSKNPALLFLGSFVLRLTITGIGFYFIGKDDWRNLLFCLAAFVVTRILITRLTKTSVVKGGER